MVIITGLLGQTSMPLGPPSSPTRINPTMPGILKRSLMPGTNRKTMSAIMKRINIGRFVRAVLVSANKSVRLSIRTVPPT
ncbi:MAG: hypothetical protein JW395_4127 [Nitrospira sp.]|nr:hypothetical protein [Nitrospira sp.]